MSAIFRKLSRSVFPVFIEAPENKDKKFDYAGNAFVIEVHGKLALVTAGHVGINKKQENTERVVIVERTLENDDNQISCTGRQYRHIDEDIALWDFSDETFSRFRHPVEPLQIQPQSLQPLHDIFTFGHPFSNAELIYPSIGNMEEYRAIISPIFVKGYIMKLVKKSTLRGMVKNAFESNYQLSFPCYPGLSGAPLLTQASGKICVAGILYGNIQTKFLRGPVDVDKDFEARVTKETYAAYDFGLSSTEEVLLSLSENFKRTNT